MTSPPQAATQTCPLCGSDQHRFLLRSFDHFEARPATVDYHRCDSCRLVFQFPIPDPGQIAGFYSADYQPHREVSPEQVRRKLARPINRFVARHLLHTGAARRGWRTQLARAAARFALQDTLLPQGSCRLLDVGCGSGSWLYHHQLLGWQATGVDALSAAVQRARRLGLEVFEGTIFDVPIDRQFDVIAMLHLIEHVPDPRATLERAAQLLTPGGTLLLELPNFDAWGYEQFGIHWFPLDPPRHLAQFTPATIEQLGAISGLKLIDLETEAAPQLLARSQRLERIFGRAALELDPPELQRRIRLAADESSQTRQEKRAARSRFRHEARRQARLGRGETMRARFRVAA